MAISTKRLTSNSRPADEYFFMLGDILGFNTTHILPGGINPGNDIAAVGATIPGTSIVATGLPSSVLDPRICQVCDVTLNTAQVTSMYTTPVNLVPAVTGKIIVPTSPILFVATKGTSAYTAGGVVQIQYHTDTNNIMANTVAAAVVNTSTTSLIWEGLTNGAGFVPIISQGLEITNATQLFATGVGSTLRVVFDYIVC